jgi:outer membrane protein assembly factor BamB
LYGNKLYLLSGNTETLSCFDVKTGKTLVDGERLEAVKGVYASPVGAKDRVYVVGRNGACAVINHKTDKLEVIATNTLDEKIDASPAIADNQLFLRGREFLYCLQE